MLFDPESQVLSSQQMGSWKVGMAELLGSTLRAVVADCELRRIGVVELLLQLLGCFFHFFPVKIVNIFLSWRGLYGIVGHLASTEPAAVARCCRNENIWIQLDENKYTEQ